MKGWFPLSSYASGSLTLEEFLRRGISGNTEKDIKTIKNFFSNLPSDTKAKKIREDKQDTKTSYKNLRSKTIASDSVETVRCMRKASVRYCPYHTATFPSIPSPRGKRESQVQRTPPERKVH